MASDRHLEFFYDVIILHQKATFYVPDLNDFVLNFHYLRPVRPTFAEILCISCFGILA